MRRPDSRGAMSDPPPALSVILPSYREAEALRDLLPRLIDAICQLTHSYEVLVVDARQGLDATREVCEKNGVRHVNRRNGDCYGDAIRTGIEESEGEHILVMDADGSHNPSQIHLLWAHRLQFDVVIGSRYIEGGITENPRTLIF